MAVEAAIPADPNQISPIILKMKFTAVAIIDAIVGLHVSFIE